MSNRIDLTLRGDGPVVQRTVKGEEGTVSIRLSNTHGSVSYRITADSHGVVAFTEESTESGGRLLVQIEQAFPRASRKRTPA